MWQSPAKFLLRRASLRNSILFIFILGVVQVTWLVLSAKLNTCRTKLKASRNADEERVRELESAPKPDHTMGGSLTFCQSIQGQGYPELDVVVNRCNPKEMEWIVDTVCKAGFTVKSFNHLLDDRTCGYRTDAAIVCGGGPWELPYENCSGKYFAGSKKIGYQPGFTRLASKTGLCSILNKASAARNVDFQVVPKCCFSEGNVSAEQAFQLALGEEKSWWAVKVDKTCQGKGVSILNTSELAMVPALQAQVVQKAILDVPTYKGRKVDHRHFFAVSSVDPPRVYFCPGGFFRSSSQPLMPVSVLRQLNVSERRIALVTNAGVHGGGHHYGMNAKLRLETKFGISMDEVERKIAEKITRAVLAHAEEASCYTAVGGFVERHDCSAHYGIGASDSILDVATGEPWIMELMFVNVDWIYRGIEHCNNDPECNGIARKALQELTRIVLSPLRSSLDKAASSSRSTTLSGSARALLSDARATRVLEEMVAEAAAAEEGGCVCALCQQPGRFIPYFPRGDNTTTLGHTWSTYYSLLKTVLESSASPRAPATA